MTSFEFKPIAIVESCFKQKFAIPRQPGLVPESRGRIRFFPEFAVPEAVEGLEQSSHIWVQFVFHQTMLESWSSKVRPPRLGGNKKIGVFATRSTHRPNPIGLSVIKLDSIDLSEGVVLEVSSLDLLDQTPVLDIKPYLPYADRVNEATLGFAENAPSVLEVSFSEIAEYQMHELQNGHSLNLRNLITQVLQQDPRPAYQQVDPKREYGVELLNFNLKWRYVADSKSSSMPRVIVTALDQL